MKIKKLKNAEQSGARDVEWIAAQKKWGKSRKRFYGRVKERYRKIEGGWEQTWRPGNYLNKLIKNFVGRFFTIWAAFARTMIFSLENKPSFYPFLAGSAQNESRAGYICQLVPPHVLLPDCNKHTSRYFKVMFRLWWVGNEQTAENLTQDLLNKNQRCYSCDRDCRLEVWLTL
jgi:hypothetical protein